MEGKFLVKLTQTIFIQAIKNTAVVSEALGNIGGLLAEKNRAVGEGLSQIEIVHHAGVGRGEVGEYQVGILQPLFTFEQGQAGAHNLITPQNRQREAEVLQSG